MATDCDLCRAAEGTCTCNALGFCAPEAAACTPFSVPLAQQTFGRAYVAVDGTAGRAFVAWAEFQGGGSGGSVKVRHIDLATGQASAPFTVASSGNLSIPVRAIAFSPALQTVLVVWTTTPSDNADVTPLFVRELDADLSPRGAARQVTLGDGHTSFSDVYAFTAAGGFELMLSLRAFNGTGFAPESIRAVKITAGGQNADRRLQEGEVLQGPPLVDGGGVVYGLGGNTGDPFNVCTSPSRREPTPARRRAPPSTASCATRSSCRRAPRGTCSIATASSPIASAPRAGACTTSTTLSSFNLRTYDNDQLCLARVGPGRSHLIGVSGSEAFSGTFDHTTGALTGFRQLEPGHAFMNFAAATAPGVLVTSVTRFRQGSSLVDLVVDGVCDPEISP